jgi:Bacterial membrane protein YfhO
VFGGTRVAGSPARRALLFSIAGLAGVIALAYLRVLFLGETFAVRDHLTWTLPSRAFLAESLRQGHLPEWWDALRLGQRFASDPNNGVTYPLAWAIALLDPLLGADLLLLFHIFLAGVGVLLLARRLGASPLGAFFGAAALMTSGYMTSMLVSGTILLPLGWMPLVAWAALGLAEVDDRRDYLGRGLVFAGVLAGSVVSGNPAGLNNIVLAGAIVVLAARRRRVALAVLAGAGLLGVLMGSVSVLVALFTLGDSPRAGGFSLAQSGAWSMHPLRLFELVWPQVLGHGLRPEQNLTELWAHGGGQLEANWSGSDYVGIPVLFCAGLASVCGKGILRRLGLLSLFFLILALGTFTPIFGLYRAVFRFEHLLRYPEKYLASSLVLWTALAAIGFDHLFDPTHGRTRLVRVSAGLALVMATGLGLVYLLRGSLIDIIVRTSQARGRGIDAQAALSVVLDGGLAATAVAAFLPIAIWLAGHPRLGRLARPGFAAVAVAQLIAHDWSMHVLIARDFVRKVPAILAPLPKQSSGELPRVLRRAQDVTPVTVSGETRAMVLHQLAVQNEATRFGFAQVPGYAIVGTSRFETFVAASGKSNLERIMDLLDIRYLIIEASQARGMGMPSRSPGMLAGHVVLENEERRARAFVAYRYEHGLSDQQVLAQLFDPDRTNLDLGAVRLAGAGETRSDAAEDPSPCTIVRPVPEHVLLHCRALRAGYAVLLDEWTQGWTAAVDGAPAPLERADVIFRAVAIPAGDHLVEMSYRTPGLRAGAMVSLGGCVLYAGLVLAWHRYRRKGRGVADRADGSRLAG